MVWDQTIEVRCPHCGKSRKIKDHARGLALACKSCAVGLVKRADDWCTTHGDSKTKLYKVWSAMKQRCINCNDQSFYLYGGRGITVCQEWLDCYTTFRDWALSSGYRKGLLIDRRENNGNYEPSNCRWVTSSVSAQNKRTSKINYKQAENIKTLVSQGYCQQDLAWAFGVSDTTIWSIAHNLRWGGERSTIATSK